MINSHYIHNKITGTNSAVKRMIGEELTDNQIIKEIYMNTLCRLPSVDELETAGEYIRQSLKRHEGLEDLLWAIITSRAFLFTS